jgi:chromosome segregation ATPase
MCEVMSERLTDDELAELRRLSDAATAAPWGVKPNQHHTQNQKIESAEVIEMQGGGTVSSVHITAWKQGHRDARPDAALIAVARNALPRLLDESAAQDATIAELRVEVRRMDANHAELLAENERLKAELAMHRLTMSQLTEIAWDCYDDIPAGSSLVERVKEIIAERDAARAELDVLQSHASDLQDLLDHNLPRLDHFEAAAKRRLELLQKLDNGLDVGITRQAIVAELLEKE